MIVRRRRFDVSLAAARPLGLSVPRTIDEEATMAHLPTAVLDHVRAHHGIITRAELFEFGVTTWQLDGWSRAGVLVRVHDGVFRIASSSDSFESRCLAACRADDELVIGGVSAAKMLGFRHTPRMKVVTAIVPHGRRPVRAEVLLRRTNLLDADEIRTDPTGIRYTAAPRTWFDRARDVRDDTFESITEFVIDRYCTVPELWATARRMMGRGRPGAARVRRVITQRAEWQKPAGSRLELEVLRALESRGIRLVRQQRVRLRNGHLIHLDGADPELKWGIEVDHVTWHGGRIDAQRDKERDLAAALVGWTVHRITDHHWAERRAGLVDELVELYRIAGGRLAA